MFCYKRLFISITCIVLILADNCLNAQDPDNSYIDGTDEGYMFSGLYAEKRTKTFKKGNTLVAYPPKGVIITENPESPWYRAALIDQGSTVTDSTGKVIVDVALYENTDAEGDQTWSIFWKPEGSTGTHNFMPEPGNGNDYFNDANVTCYAISRDGVGEEGGGGVLLRNR